MALQYDPSFQLKVSAISSSDASAPSTLDRVEHKPAFIAVDLQHKWRGSRGKFYSVKVSEGIRVDKLKGKNFKAVVPLFSPPELYKYQVVLSEKSSGLPIMGGVVIERVSPSRDVVGKAVLDLKVNKNSSSLQVGVNILTLDGLCIASGVSQSFVAHDNGKAPPGAVLRHPASPELCVVQQRKPAPKKNQQARKRSHTVIVPPSPSLSNDASARLEEQTTLSSLFNPMRRATFSANANATPASRQAVSLGDVTIPSRPQSEQKAKRRRQQVQSAPGALEALVLADSRPSASVSAPAFQEVSSCSVVDDPIPTASSECNSPSNQVDREWPLYTTLDATQLSPSSDSLSNAWLGALSPRQNDLVPTLSSSSSSSSSCAALNLSATHHIMAELPLESSIPMSVETIDMLLAMIPTDAHLDDQMKFIAVDV